MAEATEIIFSKRKEESNVPNDGFFHAGKHLTSIDPDKKYLIQFHEYCEGDYLFNIYNLSAITVEKYRRLLDSTEEENLLEMTGNDLIMFMMEGVRELFDYDS